MAKEYIQEPFQVLTYFTSTCLTCISLPKWVSKAQKHIQKHTVLDTYLVRFWYVLGTFLVRSWYIPGTFLIRSWYIPCMFLVRSWYIPGTFLVRSWYVPGTLLDFIFLSIHSIFAIFALHVFNVTCFLMCYFACYSHFRQRITISTTLHHVEVSWYCRFCTFTKES